MNGQPPVGQTSGQWPPDWEEEARRLEMYPAILYTWSTTPHGSARLAIWRALPDATAREVQWSLAPIPDRPGDAARRAVALRRALEQARRRWPDLSDETLWELVGDSTPVLSETDRHDPLAILTRLQRRVGATIEVFTPVLRADRRARTAAATEARHRESERWKRRARELRTRGFSVAQMVLKLSDERGHPTSERTIRRWLNDKNP